jgi:hypothetical protein
MNDRENSDKLYEDQNYSRNKEDPELILIESDRLGIEESMVTLTDELILKFKNQTMKFYIETEDLLNNSEKNFRVTIGDIVESVKYVEDKTAKLISRADAALIQFKSELNEFSANRYKEEAERSVATTKNTVFEIVTNSTKSAIEKQLKDSEFLLKGAFEDIKNELIEQTNSMLNANKNLCETAYANSNRMKMSFLSMICGGFFASIFGASIAVYGFPMMKTQYDAYMYESPPVVQTTQDVRRPDRWPTKADNKHKR